MTYTIKSFFYLVIISSLLASCSNSGKQYFTDLANDFKILFPGKPTSSERTIAFPFGSFSGKKYTLESTTGLNSSYSITCIDLPENIVHSDSMNLLPQLFALTQADYVREIGEGGLLNTWIKDIHKYPGREFVWNNPQTNHGHTRRVFYVRNKLYLLEVTYKSSNQHNVEINSFLNSFHLLSKDINPNPEAVPNVPVKKFHISYPGTTTSRKQVIQGTKGPQYIIAEMYQPDTYNRMDEFSNFGYGINYMDFHNEPIINESIDLQKKFISENSANNPLIQNGGEIISINESTIDGTWCIEMKALALNGQIELIAKTFFKDKYLYQVMVLSAPNKGNNEASKKFIASFRHK